MKPETFTSFTYLSSLSANPSFTRLAYVKSQVNLEDDKYDHVIMMMDQAGHQQMTYLKKESNVSWKDDDTLVFHAKRDESLGPLFTTIYALSLKGGEAFETLRVPFPFSSYTFLKDGSCIGLGLYHVDHPQFHTYSKKQREKLEKEMKNLDFMQVIKEVPFYTNGGSFIDQLRQRLVHVSADGKTITPITPINMNVSGLKLTEDESKVVFMGNVIKDVRPLHSFIYKASLEDYKVTKLSTQQVGLGGFELFNNQIVAYVNDHSTHGLNQNMVVSVLENGKFKKVFDPFYNLGNSINSDSRLYGSSSSGVYQDKLILNVTKKDHSLLIMLNKDFSVTKEVEIKGSCDGLSQLNDELILISMSSSNLQEITTLDLKPLTSFNQEVFKENPISLPKPLHITHHDRTTDGWVILPKDFNPKKSYPGILVIHGGPKTVYGLAYSHEMQIWSSEGYFVMYCNPVGGDGLGNEFADIRGQYGQRDYDDLMCFVDEALKQYPSIDSNRLGVTGGSYGGYMTNWITSHTARFKAAVTIRSICNWTSFYGVSDIGHYFVKDQVQADLLKPLDHDALWNNSPLKYVSQVTTPTLVVHSKLDYRCPIDQGYQWFSALKLLGVPTKMIMFHHENHDLTRNGKPKARLQSYKEILGWFNTYLK